MTIFLFSSSFLCSREKQQQTMCSNSRTMKKQKTKSTKTKNPSRKSTFSTNPSRKTRTKTRKHKFLSLKTELSSSKPDSPTSDQVSSENHHQLNLFPLHPGNLFEERETHYENVDYFFDSDGGATTLNGFVWGREGGGGEGSVGLGSDHEDSLSPSLTYAYQGQDSEEVGGGDESSLLVRNALRHKQRDESEEKWICYEEVLVEKKEEENSCCTEEYQNLMRGLCLKLDYEEIMNAWSDKGPLYIGGGDSSQIVPDVLDDLHAHDSTNVYSDGNVPQWKVPAGEDGNGGAIEAIDSGEGSLMLKEGERKARVLRYKEKRQSRLFSKRIRYEVRKLNAEKRPRMKGRFVKRD